MAERQQLENERCPQCGVTYRVSFVERPESQQDAFSCECGRVLRRWDERGAYVYEKLDSPLK